MTRPQLDVREWTKFGTIDARLISYMREVLIENAAMAADVGDDELAQFAHDSYDDYPTHAALIQEGLRFLDQDIRSELIIRDRRSGTIVSHRDIGVGISQVLPILVEAYASRGQILAIEQPELHLHPGLQAELGDVFIKSALGHQRNTLLVETHSEHLILRLMRRMRNTADG